MNVKILFAVFFMMLFGLTASAQHWQTGIVVKNQETNLVTYDVRLDQIGSALEADRLDQALEEKEGIISAYTDHAERLVTVQVKPLIGPRLLEAVIRQSGYEVAKKFDN